MNMCCAYSSFPLKLVVRLGSKGRAARKAALVHHLCVVAVGRGRGGGLAAHPVRRRLVGAVHGKGRGALANARQRLQHAPGEDGVAAPCILASEEGHCARAMGQLLVRSRL